MTLSRSEAPPILGELPLFAPFVDPFPLPSSTLKRERRAAAKARGEERGLAMTNLAAHLWKIANGNIDQIRALEEAARSQGVQSPQARITALRREASAHLQECVTLLEGVLETPSPPRMARVRLAHYLRELNPPAAIPLFRGLLTDEPKGPRRRGFALDLAQLLLREGAFGQAAALFPEAAGPIDHPRGRLLFALTRVELPEGLTVETLRSVLADCGGARSPLTDAIAAHVPLLLSALPVPALALERLREAPPACLRDRLPRVAAELAQRLLGRGRMGSARALREVLVRVGWTLPAELDDQVSQLAGPFVRASTPPGDARLGRLLSPRLRAVMRCAMIADEALSFTARLQADGRAALVSYSPSGRARPGRPEASGRVPSARPGSDEWGRCLGAVVRRWRLPPWEAKVELELNVTVSIRPDVRRRSQPTDPD